MEKLKKSDLEEIVSFTQNLIDESIYETHEAAELALYKIIVRCRELQVENMRES